MSLILTHYIFVIAGEHKRLTSLQISEGADICNIMWYVELQTYSSTQVGISHAIM